MLRLLTASGIAIMMAMPAFAGTSFTAKLAEPVAETTDFVANKAIWVCQGETCLAELSRKAPTVRSCKQVASEIGQLAAFVSEKGALTEAELAECNKAAKK